MTTMDLRRLALMLGAAGLVPVLAAACSGVESSHPDPLADQPGAGGAPTIPDAGKDGSSDSGDAGVDLDASGPTFGQSACGMCFINHCQDLYTACMSDAPCLNFYQCKLSCLLYGAKSPGLGCVCSDMNKTQVLTDLEACQGGALGGSCFMECN